MKETDYDSKWEDEGGAYDKAFASPDSRMEQPGLEGMENDKKIEGPPVAEKSAVDPNAPVEEDSQDPFHPDNVHQATLITLMRIYDVMMADLLVSTENTEEKLGQRIFALHAAGGIFCSTALI